MQRRWTVLAKILLIATAVAWLAKAPANAYEPVFEPVDCWFTLPPDQPVDCGYLSVPEDRGNPDSPDIRIAAAILRHPDGNPEPDPILRLHGGPGGGYLSFMELAWADDAALFGANRDVIAFDQRGQGKSEPSIQCPEVQRAYFEVQDYHVGGTLLTDEGYLDYIGSQFAECYARLSSDHNLDTYDSTANAADAADLMKTLGYESYNVHAGSYGTVVAQYLMRDRPEGVRSVVLDAPGSVNETVAKQVSGFRLAFDTVLKACAADAACNGAFPNLRQTWLESLDRVRADPPVIEAKDEFSGKPFNVLLTPSNLTMPLRLSLTSMGAMRTVPLYIANASKGDFELVAKAWGGVTARAGTFVGWGSLASAYCGGTVSVSDPADLAAAIADLPELADYYQHGPLDGRINFSICSNWPVEPATPEEVASFQSDIPTLIIMGEVDAATDFEGANEIAANLASAYGPYVFPAMGHIVGLGNHECPAAIEAAFYIEPTVEPDTSCIAGMEPLSFVTQLGGGGQINLVAYDGPGYAGVIPDGWNELQPGFFARSDPSVDKTLFVQLGAPAAAAGDMIAGILGEFGLMALPAEPLRRIRADDLTWDIYMPAGVVSIIIAKAETVEVTYLTALIASRGEIDGLADSLLIPALQALKPNP